MKRARIAALHAALLFCTMGLAIPATAQGPLTARPGFAPPEGEPMLLTRTLQRELSDGKTIVATRRYRVRFARHDTGWTIDGTLIASEIDAPPSLAALASIEQQRPDDALFPIRLDAGGLIQPRTNPGSPDGVSWRAALDVATKLVSVQRPSGSDNAPPGPMVQQMQAVAGAGSLSIWPLTLFLPEADARREERRFALPEGGEGVIVTELERLPAEGFDTMGQAQRTVVTEVAGTRRVTREQWSLERIGD